MTLTHNNQMAAEQNGHINLSKHCIVRNICEMNTNCALFGPGSELVCDISSHVIARNVATTDDEEHELLIAASHGRSAWKYSCESLYGNLCPNEQWGNVTDELKHIVRTMLK